MEVNPSVPAKTVPEFIAYAKASGGDLSVSAITRPLLLRVLRVRLGRGALQ
jgi:hypothetical protein